MTKQQAVELIALQIYKVRESHNKISEQHRKDILHEAEGRIYGCLMDGVDPELRLIGEALMLRLLNQSIISSPNGVIADAIFIVDVLWPFKSVDAAKWAASL